MSDKADDLNVEVNFNSWDGDGTVTVSTADGSITLDAQHAVEQLEEAARKVSEAREQLGWNR